MSDDGVSNKKTADTTGASLTVFSHTSTNPTMNDPPDFTIFYPSEVKSSQNIHGDQRTQDTDESGTIVESKEQQPVITNSVLEGESWLITYFEHRTPLELVQVKDSDGIIPLDSAWIKTEEISLDSSYKRKVSIQRRRMFDSYDLIMRESSESLIQWKCVLKNTTEGISSDMERDYSGAIAEASQELPSSPDTHDPLVINILLIGRSQVGKSTLIESLIDPSFSSLRTGLSQTREPHCKTLKIKAGDGKEYTLNIIDTPGLREVRHDINERRTDEQLLDRLRQQFNNERLRYLNMIGFVSVMGKTYQNDIDTFKSLIDVLDPRFKSISALILTHCDKFSSERLDQLTKDLTGHPKCKDIVNYCQLGIHHHGTLDIDDLNTLTGELRDLVRKENLKHLEPMQKKMVDFILSRAERHVNIDRQDLKPSGSSNKHWMRKGLQWLDERHLTCHIL